MLHFLEYLVVCDNMMRMSVATKRSVGGRVEGVWHQIDMWGINTESVATHI